MILTARFGPIYRKTIEQVFYVVGNNFETVLKLHLQF